MLTNLVKYTTLNIPLTSIWADVSALSTVVCATHVYSPACISCTLRITRLPPSCNTSIKQINERIIRTLWLNTHKIQFVMNWEVKLKCWYIWSLKYESAFFLKINLHDHLLDNICRKFNTFSTSTNSKLYSSLPSRNIHCPQYQSACHLSSRNIPAQTPRRWLPSNARCRLIRRRWALPRDSPEYLCRL